MNFDAILSSTDIGASGMAAERLRMEVISNNIANANSTRSANGGPYRRQMVLFASALDNAQVNSAGGVKGGVRVDGVEEDMSDFPVVFNPGHPDANEEGYVRMPNVQTALEMVDLITANRAYEANLRALRNYREMAEQALSLLQRR